VLLNNSAEASLKAFEAKRLNYMRKEGFDCEPQRIDGPSGTTYLLMDPGFFPFIAAVGDGRILLLGVSDLLIDPFALYTGTVNK
jgi:hypothetical protein